MPSDLEVVDVTRNSVALTWKKPTYNSGDVIQGYKIEKKGKTSSKWIRSVPGISHINGFRLNLSGKFECDCMIPKTKIDGIRSFCALALNSKANTSISSNA